MVVGHATIILALDLNKGRPTVRDVIVNGFMSDQLVDMVVAFCEMSCFLCEIETDVDGAVVFGLQF